MRPSLTHLSKEAGRLDPAYSSCSICGICRYAAQRPCSPDQADSVCSICWDRPKNAAALSRESGLSRERVRQLLLRLHAQERIAFVDPDHPSWLVKRADDESPVLSRDETRVLSALPPERAADVESLTRTTKLACGEVERILEKLIDGGLVEALGELSGAQAFRIAAAGLEHPQYVHTKRRLPPPHLPVRSDRVRTVLQTIADAEALRIRDVKHLTKIPQNSGPLGSRRLSPCDAILPPRRAV